ncbi:uncharacterized protein si:ch211-12e13.1 [Xyrichtys novacula]|uniref:Uncharacterized protein si:ch211-12e13.1 n=1 Tax=Xyrichtys novacula TaxID=13765 RepID=A0AAV1G5P2_XYRNO|nr:uncharacterized protein si:ch211-12e13.1 [Xyrichtys novacula]
MGNHTVCVGNTLSCVVASLSAYSVYLFYVHIYSSHTALRNNVLHNKSLPSLVYLYLKYLIKTLKRRRTGHLYTVSSNKCEVVYTAIDCRFEVPLLRKFCSAAGYGWDYPDTEFRDTPLCFPEFLCHRLLLMVLTDGKFRLSPAGLVRVRQSLKTLQPVDELKKGPFMLQVQVQEYRELDAGVEVDICLCATSRTGCPVWESVLTLLSKRKLHNNSRNENPDQPNEPAPENVKQVKLRIPRTAGLQCMWSYSAFSPYRLLFLPTCLFGRLQSTPNLWMLSVCLAEVEKHKGVEVITTPVNISVQFREPLSLRSRVTLRFWETTNDRSQSSTQSLSFLVQPHGSNTSHMIGSISRSL